MSWDTNLIAYQYQLRQTLVKKLGQKKDSRFKTRDYFRFAWNMRNISLILKLILDY